VQRVAGHPLCQQLEEHRFADERCAGRLHMLGVVGSKPVARQVVLGAVLGEPGQRRAPGIGIWT
jgi:hypothetical protein